jgi:hypothetical protein
MTKEKDPKYVLNKRKNKTVATCCRVCGGQLMTAQDIAKEIHEECDRDNNKIYMM